MVSKENYLGELQEDLQRLSIEELVKKYDLSFKELFELSKQIDVEDKYIIENVSGSYSVSKSVNGVSEYFGSYMDKEEAIKVRDELIKCNWDKEKFPEILNELEIKSKCGGGWTQDW
jgi:N-glycosylase/DNA lyase